MSAPDLARLVELALACVHREYPNKIGHVMSGDADALPPRRLTPVFWGCFDWHSAVHGHWALARFARLHAGHPAATRARAALGRGLVHSKVEGEVAYFEGAGRASSERPYGLAWLLTLALELREWDDDDARRWSAALAPLEALCARRMREWLPKLGHPIRTGEHGQTAFAMALCLDWARRAQDPLAGVIEQRARDFHVADVDGPIAYEPSGHDFLSPCLAEADLMRRVLEAAELSAWLGRFLPHLPTDGDGGWLQPVVSRDRSDGKLAHLDGLNLSRAWMLEGLEGALDPADPRRAGLAAAAHVHREAGLASVTDEHYEGAHWLGSFAIYLTTRRGIPTAR